MNIYKFADNNYKDVYVVAPDWTRAYDMIAKNYPKFDVQSAENVSIDTMDVLIDD